MKSAVHRATGQHVAIKILEKSKITEVADVERVSREIHILKLIRHPNIVQLYEIIETPKQLFLIMEYMGNGELFDYIVEHKRIPEPEAVRIFGQLVAGIEYIHRIGVVHRDLKPENILLDYRKAVKIVDFGLSNTYRKGEQLKTPCGSPCYAAPEMIRGEKYDGLRVDIWSCGVILFAMLCGYLPFEDPDTPALYKKITAGSYSLHKALSDPAKDLIARVLNGNQAERYGIEQIRSHPWMKGRCGESAEGIVVGFNKIPIDRDILGQMKALSLDPDYVQKCLEANRHNNATTSYYLSLKKHVSEGGQSSCDLASKSFDKSVLEPNRRKNTANQLLLDNYITKSTEDDARKKSRSKDRPDKENRCYNQTSTVLTSVNADSKRRQTKPKPNDSFNYGRPNKSIDRAKREPLENHISRKYREKFNQSLVSRSKEKCSQRSRINSSLNGCKKELPGALLEEAGRPAKGKKNLINTSFKHDATRIEPSKSMKIRRI